MDSSEELEQLQGLSELHIMAIKALIARVRLLEEKLDELEAAVRMHLDADREY